MKKVGWGCRRNEEFTRWTTSLLQFGIWSRRLGFQLLWKAGAQSRRLETIRLSLTALFSPNSEVLPDTLQAIEIRG